MHGETVRASFLFPTALLGIWLSWVVGSFYLVTVSSTAEDNRVYMHCVASTEVVGSGWRAHGDWGCRCW